MEIGEIEKTWRPTLFKKVLLAAGTAAVAAALWLSYEVFLPHAGLLGTKEIEIPQGYGSRMIGQFLKDEGVIQSKWAFVTYATLLNRASDLKPGRYVVSDGATIAKLLTRLVEGDRLLNEKVLTIPEGWNLRDIGRYLAEENIGSAGDFWALAGLPAGDYRFAKKNRPKDLSAEFSFLPPPNAGVGLEGYLFPDTYRVYRSAVPEDVIRKMLSNFARRVLDAGTFDEAAGSSRSPFDIVRMASMLEKEVVSDDDRALVSGILWKRLGLGIPLQVDATIIYIRGEKHLPISASDKAIDSPYNTYRYRGLPLGPISNPGISAIRAAIHPQASPYLYYLSAPDGRTIYSKTLEEHNKAKARYLR